ncbi:hypothetical protein CDD82_7781 [Ophiocordyceps australis]|uniref:Uncharacterized protein n=1 Tax=Ophiocordyceps australis TaxID=1399860 RepID=A0A2C5XU28_9HYPO|nr:hypothetical protein CDD82_7781 [Ophiocordyceps australis]
MAFSAFSIENHNSHGSPVIVASLNGPVPIERGASRSFDRHGIYDVACMGMVIFEVVFDDGGPLQIKPRDSFDPEQVKVSVSVKTEE